MGHTATIAFGIARAQPERRIICLVDGDGSVIMHMGGLGIIGQSGVPNLLHVVINNGAHDSVGGQPTVGFGIDLVRIAESCGYGFARCVSNAVDLGSVFTAASRGSEPAFIEIRVRQGSRRDLGRPKSSPMENRNALMRRLDVLEIL
jgi:phosphonopyruvate decarboxylase